MERSPRSPITQLIVAKLTEDSLSQSGEFNAGRWDERGYGLGRTTGHCFG